MRRGPLLAWVAVGVLLAAVLPGLLRRANPLYPARWSVSNEEARTIALERLRDLGELPADPWVAVTTATDEIRRQRLSEALRAGRPLADVQSARVTRDFFGWKVTVYRRDAPAWEWAYRARVSPDGVVTQLERHLPDDEGQGAVGADEARARAEAFLAEQGIDLGGYEAPEVRSRDLETRVDTILRFRDREALFGEAVPYGIAVTFAGEELVGFEPWIEDPDEEAIEARSATFELWSQVWIFGAIVLAPLMAAPFLRRYHAGEIGVRRGLQIAADVMACGLVVVLLCVRGIAEDWTIGNLTRPQVAWVGFFQLLALYFLPMAVMALLAWSVGESLCRERHGRLLAALDALYRLDWRNATFARSALVGAVAGLGSAALAYGGALALAPSGFRVTEVLGGPPWWPAARAFSIPLVLLALACVLYAGLFGQLFLVSWLRRRLPASLAAAGAAAIGAALFFPPFLGQPVAGMLAISFLFYLVQAVVFLRHGILAALVSQLTATVVPAAVPLLAAPDGSLQLQASLALLLVASPLVLSLRHLASDREFVYRYDEVPPHVRRIAERERQKVELETARRIQSSILPELPPEVNGLAMAHAYLPATEIGGDFYDVLALEDGRVAVAVGDVAGHGVSSGLMMSMAKSALAVQVTFDPEVAAVFATLNRLVYQSARRRLLTTLCYALIDPREGEISYASAGHLFPYRITAAGRVLALESVSYPLGVRDALEVRVRSERLEPGDLLFLFSDGVVEARADGSEEPFGFERLERALARCAGGGVGALRDGLLAELAAFAGDGPRDDDLTVLVVQMPAAGGALGLPVS